MTPRNIHRHTLANGLRLVTVPLHDTQAVTVFVFAKVGSRYERRSLNGVSHFIEHLMFKGTRRRPNTLAISKLLDGVGASYNAFTSKDWTGYYVKINHEHTDLALDILSDMLGHSKFDSQELERERGVIIEEINMYDDNPLMSIEDLFESTVFGSVHPLGWNIAGPRHVIRRVSRASMIGYRDRYYHAENMWVVAAGQLPKNLDAMVNRHFRKFPRRPTTPHFRPYRIPAATKTVRIKHKELEQVQVGLGTRAYGYTDRRLPALNLLGVVLGGNMSSRLFIQVRERRGLAYSVHTSVNPYEDTGTFMIQAGLEKTKLDGALTVMLEELKRIKQTKVGPAELKRAKEFLRGKMILDLEDSDSLASWYGRQALFHKKIEDPEEAMARIGRVTSKEIQALAKTLFRPSNMRLAVIGPFKQTAPLAKLIRRV
ncbi:MAG: insulinase family protein [Candidatus Kerfeldbacteria bacterium]|nr:insulinase family protein [Candidatus Kerfeldbacteria bacterium]